MTDAETIEFFNRYTGQVEREKVYGANWLRWSYTHPLGRLALKFLVKRACFSNWYGWRMDRPGSRAKVLPFIREFQVDSTEFADPCDSYQTFNEFFYRKLKPGARPVDSNPNNVVFPADGRHLGFQDVSQTRSIFVKGQQFDLPALLGDPELAARYANGALVLSRLCPVDYHRFHFPTAGIPGESRLINGPLYSVNPLALRRRIAYLWENRRMITPLNTERFGQVLLIEIGATNVGSIVQTFQPGKAVAKGDEKGYFRFGGSSTITLFEPGKVTLAPDLIENSQQTRELYARVGDTMAMS